MTTLTYTEQLTVVHCTCGIAFAVPDTLNRRALDERGPQGFSLCCPLGHRWHYTGKTEAEKERDKRLRVEAEAARLEAQLDQERARIRTLERSRAAVQGQVTRARKAAAATRCPVEGCQRTFTPIGMQRHINSQHPHWHPEPVLAEP